MSSSSNTCIATEGASSPLHADFGSGTWDGGPIGIPYTTVPGTQAKVKVTFDDARRERSGALPDPGQRADRGRLGLDR